MIKILKIFVILVGNNFTNDNSSSSEYKPKIIK